MLFVPNLLRVISIPNCTDNNLETVKNTAPLLFRASLRFAPAPTEPPKLFCHSLPHFTNSAPISRYWTTCLGRKRKKEKVAAQMREATRTTDLFTGRYQRALWFHENSRTLVSQYCKTFTKGLDKFANARKKTESGGEGLWIKLDRKANTRNSFDDPTCPLSMWLWNPIA